MANDMTIRRGMAAAELLKSDFFKEVVDGLRADAYANWLRTLPDQSSEREEFYFMSLALAHLVQRLEAMESSGKIEQKKAAEEAARATKTP